jgi:hypothetical protein
LYTKSNKEKRLLSTRLSRNNFAFQRLEMER